MESRFTTRFRSRQRRADWADSFMIGSISIFRASVEGKVSRPFAPKTALAQFLLMQPGVSRALGHNLVGNTRGMIGLTASDLQNVRPALGPLKHNLVVSSIASGSFR